MNEQDKTAIIGAIELEIDGYLDGAPDANEASKLANRISLIIQNGLPLPYALPKGSITRECEAVAGREAQWKEDFSRIIAENNQLKDALKNLRDYCAEKGWDISTSNRVAEPANAKLTP